jgi:uncharacterized protein (TIGR02453 family)
MAYFTTGYTDFFKGLAANNHKEWFHDHKKQYEQQVREPFKAFMGDLIAAIQQRYDKDLDLLPKEAIFRINRDIRFSKDKTPYKLNRSAVISRGGRKNKQYPGFYVQLGVEEHWLGGGAYFLDKENLYALRTYMLQHPKETQQHLNDTALLAVYGGIQGDKNKRLPKEFKAAQETLPILANKQFYFMKTYEEDETVILKADLLDWVLEHYEAGMAWNAFLTKGLYG